MTDPEETLSAIDAAIEGWNGYDDSVSDDAMRWAPANPEPEWPDVEPTMTFVDEVHHWSHAPASGVFMAPRGTMYTNATPDGSWTEIGSTAEDWGVLGESDGADEDPPTWPPMPTSQTFTLTPEQVETLRHFTDHIRRQHDTMRRAIQGFAKSLLKVVGRTHATMAPAMYGDGYRRHRRNCRACNPAGNPKPLNVDGREYARRRKNRSRRHG